MRKEQLQNIISYLESIKDANGDYKKYIESLDLLASRLLDYYTPNYKGEYMDITMEEYNELDGLFKDAIGKSEFYAATEFADEKNEIAKELKKSVNDKLHKEFLTDFYADFKKIDIKSGKSFYEEMQKAKEYKVEPVEEVKNDEPVENKEEEKKESRVGDISASKIYVDGFFQKDNMTVDYGNEKISGTFIYKTDYDPDKQIDNLIKEFSYKYPEYKTYFQGLNDINKVNELGAIPNNEMIDKNGNANNFFAGKVLKVNDDAAFNEFKNQSNFLNANAEFILKLRPVLKEIQDYSFNLKATNGINLDTRNVAVTGIAKLFDKPEVVANAKSVSIEKDIDGKKVYTQGTFIENAKGKTINEFNIKDDIHTSKLEDWDTAIAKKALANLQVIDYICGNKRDVNNIKFNFDLETKKLVGVQGINNEKSFFTPNIKPQIIGEEDYTELEDIKAIDGEMAAKILAFQEVEFKAIMVQYGLNKDEVHEAWRRVEYLQDVIKDPKILGDKLKIVEDNAWDKLKLEDLAKDDNIFAKVVDAQKTLTSEMKVDKSLEENYKILNNSYKDKLIHADNFLEEARRNAPLFGTSKRYSNILKGLDDYNKTADLEEKAKKLDNLQSLVNTYKMEKVKDGVIDDNGKPIKNLSGKDLGRVNVVNKIDAFIGQAKALDAEINEAKKAYEDDEKKVDEYNATYRFGKYKNYAKVFKNDKGQILINSNILERERQNNIILTDTTKEMVKLSNGVDLDKFPDKKEKYNILKNYLTESIKSYKEQLKIDYHHGEIPKEFFDYKNERYDKHIFGFEEDEKLFAYENPESKIFKNSFHEELKDILAQENKEEEMIEMEDFSNKQELEINQDELKN